MHFLADTKRAHHIGWAEKIPKGSNYPKDIESVSDPQRDNSILVYIPSVRMDLDFADRYSIMSPNV